MRLTSPMDTVEQYLTDWRASLVKTIPLAGLYSRNPVAYKWKALHRCWVLREAAFWRITDLLTQSYALHKQGRGLGARILLRSSYETLGTLLYLNHNMSLVLESELSFEDFNDITAKQVVGSRKEADWPDPINVLKMLDKGDRKYPGLRSAYDSLSESAHPNFEGLVWGYSQVDHGEFETNFSDRWMDLYGEQHLPSMERCMATFDYEYDSVWTGLIENLENWIVANDTALEANKGSASSP